MRREEIKSKLDRWVDGGLISSKKGLGMTYSNINRAIAHGELFATSFDNIITRSIDVRDEFERMIKSGDIMNATTAKVRTGNLTEYRICKACAEGELMRFSRLGNGAILYIQ